MKRNGMKIKGLYGRKGSAKSYVARMIRRQGKKEAAK